MPVTQKQIDATLRNNHIRRLHALAGNSKTVLDPDLVEIVRGAINAQLARLGAQSLEERYEQIMEELKKELL